MSDFPEAEAFCAIKKSSDTEGKIKSINNENGTQKAKDKLH